MKFGVYCKCQSRLVAIRHFVTTLTLLLPQILSLFLKQGMDNGSISTHLKHASLDSNMYNRPKRN